MTYRIKPAQKEQVDRICTIMNQAKTQMKGLNIDQWQKGYPSREIWLQDIAEQRCYVYTDEDGVQGVFTFMATPEASYRQIDGAWLADVPYASMHRVCVADSKKGQGIAGRLFDFGCALALEKGLASMRIDTHPGNLPMQRALGKSGFQTCGMITLADGCEKGDARIAYEKLMKAEK